MVDRWLPTVTTFGKIRGEKKKKKEEEEEEEEEEETKKEDEDEDGRPLTAHCHNFLAGHRFVCNTCYTPG